MPYRPLGYRPVSAGRLLLPAAHNLIRLLSAPTVQSYNFAIGGAIRKTFNPRDHIKPVHPDAWLQLQSQPVFADREAYKSLMTIIYSMLAQGGFGDHMPQVPEYVTDPIMTIDEIINEALGDLILKKLPPPQKYSLGDKTQFSHFADAILPVVQEIATLSRRRAQMLDHFQRYMGNILYCLYDGTMDYKSLKPFEKTCIAVYMYHTDPKYRVTNIGGTNLPLKFPVARDADPLLEETMVRLRSVCIPGSWESFTRIISNADPAELTYVVAPVLPSAKIVAGKRTDRGPYVDLDLKETETLEWGEDNQMRAFLQHVTYEEDAEYKDRFISTGFRQPIRNLDMMNMPLLADMDKVTLNFRTTSPTQERLVAEWQSDTLKRLITDVAGGHAGMLLDDMARQYTSSGNVTMANETMVNFKRVDLEHPSMKDRYITGFYTRADRNAVFERIYYVKDGSLRCAEIDMTNHYISHGDIGFKPAMIEYMQVPKSWFDKEIDPKARSYIEMRLNLTRYDKTESDQLITVSHNAARYTRYTANVPDFGNLSLGDYLYGRCRVPKHSTFANPSKIA